MPLQYRETYVNETRGHSFGESGWLDYDGTRGELFHDCKREYGRCTSKIYQDARNAHGEWIVEERGWVFQKRMEYEDAYRISDKAERTYIREIWVHVREVAE